jgi:hypothetical protein
LEILNHLPPLTISTAVVGVFVTGSLLILLRDWSQALLALAIQYLLFAWLLTTIVPLPLALIKALTGGIACVILYWSGRRIGEPPVSPLQPLELNEAARRKLAAAQREITRAATGFSMRMPFRVSALSLLVLVTYALFTRYPLPGMSPAVRLACTWLATASLTLLALTQAPLRIGMGLLTWLMAFETFYVTVERSLTIAGLLGIVTLFVALGAGYLTSVGGALPPDAISEVEA